MSRRILIPALAALLGLCLLALAALVALRPEPTKPVASVGGPFALTSHEGKPITEQDFAGAPFLVFFGFTHCPDVCPTKLFEMSEALRATGERGAALRALFVSVDPERDTPAILKDYVSNFDPRIVAATADQVRIDAMVRAYRAYYKRVPLKDGGYTIDHTAGVYLMDKQGRFLRLIDMNRRPEIVAQDLLAAL